MPISNIPGVGPTNADIATAVAAPSAATIAAAVAAPSAATIAAAVAAPSSATIASAVAAAVPTTAGITSIVQANAGSPFGGTWTSLGNVSPTGTTTVNFTGIGGYRRYRLVFNLYSNEAAFSCGVRLNGSSANYVYWGQEARMQSTAAWQGHVSTGGSRHFLQGSSTTNGYNSMGYCDIFEASGAGWKEIQSQLFFNSGATTDVLSSTRGFWRETSAVTSITVICDRNFTLGISNVQLFGGN